MAHWNHWSLVCWRRAWLTLVSSRGSVVVPVNVLPPSFETLTRMSLLQAPGVFTPVNRIWPVAGSKPVGMHPFDSFECLLMYEPHGTTTCAGFVGLTAPEPRLAAAKTA